MKESYENMEILLTKLKYHDHAWKVCVDDAKSLLSAVSDASTRVNLSSYIVNGFCRKYAN